MDIKHAIERVVCSRDLSREETFQVFDQIMSGKATPVQIGALITALRMKGETVEEITGAAKVMREKAVRIKALPPAVDIDRDDINLDKETILDTCGTGGSGTNTFNISTTVAFVMAGCGVTVAKHGNRSASSQCGSADVLEQLGVVLDIPKENVEDCINNIGVGFMYAPLFHGAMKYAVKPRKEIGIRTIFNILGPLSNPAGASCQVLGVYREELTSTMARVLRELGSRRAYVVYGKDTLDEVTITDTTRVCELSDGNIRCYDLDPEDFGLKKSTLEAIRGGSAEKNAEIVRSVLSGAKGPQRDVVLMNSSLALMASGKVADLKQGVEIAASAVDSGKAEEKLRLLIDMTRKFGRQADDTK